MSNKNKNFSSGDIYIHTNVECCDNVRDMLAPSQFIPWYKIRHTRQVNFAIENDLEDF